MRWGLAALFLLFFPWAHAEAPSKPELRAKSTKELKAILKSKGAKCKKCLEKDDYVERVIETWGWTPKQAASPDGNIKMDKDTFIQQLKQSYKKQKKEDADSDDEAGGHDVEDDEGGLDPNLPDFEQVWKDFAQKLAQGDLGKDENGLLNYEVGSHGGSWWERYKMHIMIGLNVVLFWFTMKGRRRERSQRAAERDAVEAAGEEKEESEPLKLD